MESPSPNIPMSPYVSKMSSKHNSLIPGDNRRSFTPLSLTNTPKTPNLSPIVKPPVDDSGSSSFLKRREPTDVMKRIQKKQFATQKVSPFTANFNTMLFAPAVLNQSINVKSTLKALKLSHLEDIFEHEEINTMMIFFTLKNADLELIGVDNQDDRKKILEFITSFKTPTKPSNAVRC